MSTNKIQHLSPAECQTGDILAHDLHTEDGRKITTGGTKLTENMLRRIVSMNVSEVPIHKPEAPPEDEDDTPETTKTKETPSEQETPSVIKDDKRIIINDDLTEDYVAKNNVVLNGSMTDDARLVARGDILINGPVKSGFIRSLKGTVRVDNQISGDQIDVISGDKVTVRSIRDCSLSVQGDLIIQKHVQNAHLDCEGNLLLHREGEAATIRQSEVQVHGKMLADDIEKEANHSSLYFKNPDRAELEDRKETYRSELEQTRSDLKKLKKVADAAEELETTLEKLESKNRQKFERYLNLHEKRQDKETRLEAQLRSLEEQLEDLNQKRHYFLRVLGEVKAGTEITCSSATLRLRQTEKNVRFYKKGGIRILNARSKNLDELPWANALWTDVRSESQ